MLVVLLSRVGCGYQPAAMSHHPNHGEVGYYQPSSPALLATVSAAEREVIEAREAGMRAELERRVAEADSAPPSESPMCAPGPCTSRASNSLWSAEALRAGTVAGY